MLNNSSLKLNFDWSFRPIVFFLRCLGVDVSSSDGKSLTNRLLTHCYALLWFTLNLGINVYTRFIATHVINVNFTTLYNSTMNVIITIGFVGNHLILLLIVRPRFAAVLNSFHALQNLLHNCQIFITIRRFSLICVIFFLFLRFSIDILFLFDTIATYSILDLILDQFIGWPHSLYYCSLYLFALSCFTAATSLNSIQREIKQFHLLKMSAPLALNRLKKWKQCHALICDSVDAIADCFGPTLLFTVTYVLLRFILLFVAEFSDGFSLTADLSRVANFSGFVQFLFWFVLCCVPVHHLRSKAEILLNELLQLNLPSEEPEICESVNGLAIQIFQSIPQFSAMGWFDIDMSLFLQLGDLTFSYYVVLISDLREYVIKNSVTTTAPVA